MGWQMFWGLAGADSGWQGSLGLWNGLGSDFWRRRSADWRAKAGKAAMGVVNPTRTL